MRDKVKTQIMANEAVIKELKLKIAYGIDTVKNRAKWQRQVRNLEGVNRELKRSL